MKFSRLATASLLLLTTCIFTLPRLRANDATANDTALNDTEINDTAANTEEPSVLEAATDAVKEAVTDAVVETVTAATADVVQDKTLVLRISREFIRSRVPNVVDQATPVDRCLFGAKVTGEAITNGHPLVVENGTPEHPSFIVQFSGTTVAETNASKGPVRAFSTSQAEYTVQRVIHFNADGFHAEEPTIECRYDSSLKGVDVPPRLVGRVVKRIAMPQIEQTQPAADSIAKRDLETQVLDTFTTKTDTLVHDLNQRMPWKDVLKVVAPNGSERVRTLSTTPVYVEIRSRAVDSVVPDLPVESADLRAPIELWVLGEPGPVVSAELLALWGLSRLTVPAVKEAAEEVIQKAADVVADVTDDPDLQQQAHGFEPELLGEWWVLRLGADLMERILQNVTSEPAP